MKLSKQKIIQVQKEIAELFQKLSERNGVSQEHFDQETNYITFKLELIIDEIGWPTRSILGDVTAAEAWSIAILNPDPARVKKYLNLIHASPEMMQEKSYVVDMENLNFHNQ